MAKEEIDAFVYMMAAEKLTTLLSLMDQTMEFMDEYKIKPDDEVRKELKPILDRMKKWTENKWSDVKLLYIEGKIMSENEVECFKEIMFQLVYASKEIEKTHQKYERGKQLMREEIEELLELIDSIPEN